MSPRTYNRTRRAAAAQETRRRIVAAAIRLHSRRGSSATSWDDIAAAAGVSRATVYNHFGSLDELIPACASDAFTAIDPPTADQAAGVFAGLATLEARICRLIAENCLCYEAGAEWLRTAWAERDFVPAMGDAVWRVQDGLARLVDAVLAESAAGPAERRLLLSALDFSFWDTLVRAGFSSKDVPAQIERMVLPVLESLTKERR